MLFKIVWRNILKHKAKSIVVGLILFIGSLIMTVGNASLTGMDVHVSKAIADDFLGDIVIMSSNQDAKTAVFQAMGSSPEIFPQYREIETLLKDKTEVAGYLPFTIGFLLILTENSNPLGYPAGIFCIGADLKKYQDYFQNLDIIEGNSLVEGERGVLINHYMRDFYYQFNGDLYYPNDFPYRTNHLPEALQQAPQREINDSLIIMGISSKNSTIDLRVPVKGIIHFKTLKTFWREICILDIDSFREAMNYNTTDTQVVLNSEEEKSLFADLDAEELFSEEAGNFSIEEVTDNQSSFDLQAFLQKEEKIDSKKLQKDSYVYQLIAVKLNKEKVKNPKQVQKVIEELNLTFQKNNIAAKAVGWKVASGVIGSFVDIIRFVLFVIVMIIFFVAIIVIMNTLAMSVLERSKELGMMRAIGTPRNLIGKMLLGETFTLSAIFGGLGVVVGCGLVLFLASLNLSSSNEFAQLIFGGNTYRPQVDLLTIVLGLLQLILVTLFSVIYPILTARKISPKDAVSRG